MKKSILAVLVMMTVVFLGAGMAFGFGSFLTTPGTGFDAVYPSATAISNCALCHLDPGGGGPLNPYGTDFASTAIPGHTSNVFDAALEALDSDGDSFSNIVEINAGTGTNPGDSTSHPALPSPITLISPNGGEVIPSGTEYAIMYSVTAPATVTRVKVQYSLDGGVSWAQALPGPTPEVLGTTFYWDVPAPVKNKKNVLVKLIGFDGTVRVGADRSAAVFTIEVATITAPTATDPITVVPKGTLAYPVTWITNGTKRPATDATVFYTFGTSGIWKKAAGQVVNPLGSFSWDVPSPVKPKNVKLKVVLKDALGKVAQAVSGTFRIE
jgi:hypothetical protein